MSTSTPGRLGRTISTLQSIQTSLKEGNGDLPSIELLIDRLQSFSQGESDLHEIDRLLSLAPASTTDRKSREVLERAHRQFRDQFIVGQNVPVAPLFGETVDLSPKKIPDNRLLITDRGVIAFRGKENANGETQLILLRTPPWAVRDLFGQGIVRLFIAAGGRLRIGTGRQDTDLEFPGFFGKFVNKDMAHILLFPDEIAAARHTLERSYLGSTWEVSTETLAASYPEGAEVPDLAAETKQLESPFPFEGENGIWRFHAMSQRGDFKVGDFNIGHLGEGKWRIHEDGIYVGDIDLADHPIDGEHPLGFMNDVITKPGWASIRKTAMLDGKPMIVSLGGGSGFTAEEASSHMIVDENGEVTIVDPNVDIVRDLKRLGVPLKRVKRIVVSHIHYDHIAGIWQLIRRLHNPELIIQTNPKDAKDIAEGNQGHGEMSTLKALVDAAVGASGGAINGEQLLDAVKIVPMRFMENMKIGSLRLRFFHGNHTIPAVGYSILNPDTGKPAFLFTGDTRMDLPTLTSAKVMRSDGEIKSVMTQGRADFLANMVVHTLLMGGAVFGDAGVAPVHPTTDYYKRIRAGLLAVGTSEAVADRMMTKLFLYHTSRKDAESNGFNYAAFGWGNAVPLSEQLDWTPPRARDVNDRLIRQALISIPVLRQLNAVDYQELATMGEVLEYKAGDKIMTHGDTAEDMMMILDGAAIITRGNKEIKKLTSGLIGEGVFTGERTRNADVRALTDIKLLRLGSDAVQFLTQKGIAARIVDLRKLREGTVDILKELDSSTRDSILLGADTIQFNQGEPLIEEGDTRKDLFIILDGRVNVSSRSGTLAQNPVILEAGAVIGEGTLLGSTSRNATVRAETTVQALHLSEHTAKQLMDSQGGALRYYLLGLMQERNFHCQAYACGGGSGMAHGPMQRRPSYPSEMGISGQTLGIGGMPSTMTASINFRGAQMMSRGGLVI